MGAYLLRRIIESVGVFFLLSVLVFLLFDLIPGDYLSEMELNPSVSSRQVADLRRDYGLGDPFYVQYVRWLGQILQGNLGYSFSQHRPAADLIFERMGNTGLLTLGALFLTLGISVPLAVFSALRAGSRMDRLALAGSLVGLSTPTVLMGLLFLYLAYWTGWLPLGGRGGLSHLVLPSLTLSLPLVAFFYRTLRLEMIEALNQPFVLAAAARGLSERQVRFHALRNALNPLISMTGLLLGGLLSGAVVVEKVFDWPGLGALTVSSIVTRDLYVALNSVLVASVLVVTANLAADLGLAWNDPRVR